MILICIRFYPEYDRIILFLHGSGLRYSIGIILSYITIQFILDNKSNVNLIIFWQPGLFHFRWLFFLQSSFFISGRRGKKIFKPGTLSFFQPIYVFLSLINSGFFGITSKIMKGQKWFSNPSIIILYSASFFFILVSIFAIFLWQFLKRHRIFAQGCAVLKQIIEAQPLFYTLKEPFLGGNCSINLCGILFAFGFIFQSSIFLLLYLIEQGSIKGPLFL